MKSLGGVAVRPGIPVTMLLAAALGLAACQVPCPNCQSGSSSASPDSCFADSQCMSGNCEAGKCSFFMKPGGCRFDSDCSRLEHCLGGSCTRTIGACDFDSDCSFGEQCSGSHCWQK